MRWLIPIIIVVCLVVAIWLGARAMGRAKSMRPEAPVEQQSTPKREAIKEKSVVEKRVEIREVEPGPFLDDQTLVTAEGFVFETGRLCADGYVEEVVAGAARVVNETRTLFVVAKGGSKRVEFAQFGVRIFRSGEVAEIVIQTGERFAVGDVGDRGEVERVERRRVVIRRPDGGHLFICHQDNLQPSVVPEIQTDVPALDIPTPQPISLGKMFGAK